MSAQVLEFPSSSIAVLVPCLNEAAAIEKVINSFRASLPGARIYVYDNGSSDDSPQLAESAGASVRHVPERGKGHVVRRMFADIDADIYVLVDGDDTYDAQAAPRLIRELQRQQLDMVVGTRLQSDDEGLFPSLHRFGNHLLTRFVSGLFGRRIDDMLSGYRVFSRRFVKSFPVSSHGFEIETELTIHTLSLHLPMKEVEAPYRARPEDSHSKLNTFKDGFRILRTIVRLLRTEKPMEFYGGIGLVLCASSLFMAVPILLTYLEIGLVPRFPTAILATGVMLAGFLSITTGLILDTVTAGRREARKMFYLTCNAFKHS